MLQASSGMHVTASSAAPVLAVSQTPARSKTAVKTERCGADPPLVVAMLQASSGMHVTASSAAPILAVSQTPARSKTAVKAERRKKHVTVMSGQRSKGDWVGQLYQMVKVNVNGVIKNLMIPVESPKKSASAGAGDAVATPGSEVSVTLDRPDAVSTPQPLLKPNSSNTKLVIVSQSRSLLGCNSRTSDHSSMSSSSSSSSSSLLLSPSSVGTSSVSSAQSSYGSPPYTPPTSGMLCPVTSLVSRVTSSTVNAPAPRSVIVSRDRIPPTELGRSTVKTHVIQPAVGMNKHLVISGVPPVASPAIQTVVTSAGVQYLTPVQLAGSEVAVSRPTVVAQTATSEAPLLKSLVARQPQVRTIRVVSAVPTATASPVTTPVVVGMPQSGTKHLVFPSTMPVLRPTQMTNGTPIFPPTNAINQPVLVTTAVRPAGSPVVGTLASQPVPAMTSSRQLVVHSPPVQKPGAIFQPVVAGDNLRTVVLTVPVTGPSSGKAVAVSRVVQSPKPRQVVATGIPSIAPPPASYTSPALGVTQVRPVFTTVRSPSSGATAASTIMHVSSVAPRATCQATSPPSRATESGTFVITQPKPLAKTGSNTSIPRYDSPHLKIGDVFSLQKGDSRIPSPLPGAAVEPVCHGSGMQLPVTDPSPESPLPPKDSGVVVLASWNKDEYCSSDNANDDSSDRTSGPCPLRKTRPINRTTRVHRRTHGKFFQDAVTCLTGCRVSLRPLGLDGRTTVSASEFDAERGKSPPGAAKSLRRAVPRCFLDAADPRRGDRYSIDADGRSLSAIFVTECVRLSDKKARQRRKKASSPQKPQKSTSTISAVTSLAKNDAPKWMNQIVTGPTPIAPKGGANSVIDKKLRYLMVKTNAGTFLVPISSSGGLLNGGSTNTISLPSGANRPVTESVVTPRQTAASGSVAKDTMKVAVKDAPTNAPSVHRTTSGTAAKDTAKVASNDSPKIVSLVKRTTENRTQYVMVSSQMSSNYTAQSGRSLLSQRIKSEPLKPGYEDAIQTPTPPKRVKLEFDYVARKDAPACTQLPPPPSMSGLSNKDRITQLKLELKKQQETVEVLRRRRLESFNMALSDSP